MTTWQSPNFIPTTQVRDKLSTIITRVQDPRRYCILTRHGKAVAAIVSMAELKRIWNAADIDAAIAGHRPAKFTFGTGDHMTNHEAAEAIRELQMDRWMEREVLKKAGMHPVPGGELAGTVRKRRWWLW